VRIAARPRFERTTSPELANRTKGNSPPEVERLWRRDDVAMREKALWRLLYETAARASEALNLRPRNVAADESLAGELLVA
jgi:integrase